MGLTLKRQVDRVKIAITLSSIVFSFAAGYPI